ncbi:MAG: 50S ribosomal protein L22 [Armatimonadetes bacterium]|nr:50S ribosomal protein L22 [Armatimonadota bacterium]NOG91852.1 50S ribosomal protein L22 [Armatimonadota bacterium]
MEVRAVGKGLRVQPRKVRLVAREVRGDHAVLALAKLQHHKSKGARMLHKVLRSAVGNAMENNSLSPETLVISRIQVDEGMRLKRIRARAQGRANRILKRTSHITVVLTEGEPFAMPKSNAKPKPRPKFEAPKPKKERAAKPAAEEAPQEQSADQPETTDAAVESAAEPAETIESEPEGEKSEEQ